MDSNQTGLNGMSGLIISLLFFFGLGLIGLVILIVSARYSRSVKAVVTWGIVAGVFMVVECLLLGAMAGIGSATSGSQSGYHLLSWPIIVFVASLIIYFLLALAKFDKSKPPPKADQKQQKHVEIKQKY
jgi:uncharacterized membrane protein YjfL (UPF0719 family)